MGFIYSVLRYPGGKSRAVKTIIDYFPKEANTICSPFFGGGSIEFCLASKGYKIYGYDLFEPLITFWKCLKENSLRLSKEVKKLYPMTKNQFRTLQNKIMDMKDPFEKAAAFYVLNRSSFSGTTLSGGMSPNHPRFNENSIERLNDFNTYDVEFNTKDFVESIHKHKNDFLYLDPPYYIESNLYGNKGDLHKKFDHEKLFDILSNRNGWILSYNNSEKIVDMYKDYEIIYPFWKYGMGNKKDSKEVLIVNY